MHDTAGWVFLRAGQVEKALALLGSAASKYPANAEIQYHLGMAQLKKGDKTAARAHLEKAVEGDVKYYGLEKARKTLAELSR